MTHPYFGEQEFIVASRIFTVVTEGEAPFIDELPTPIAVVVNEPVRADVPAVPPKLRPPPPGRFLSVEDIADL